jgi:RNA polymerase sigma factor (sigma-70 family)
MRNEPFELPDALREKRGEDMLAVNDVKNAQKGDKEALLKLILSEKDAYYRLAYSYMQNEADAMDVLEDMIVKLYEQIGQLKKEESFYSWSKTILVNQCKQSLKKNKRVIPLEYPLEERNGNNNYAGMSDYRQVEEQMDLQSLMVQLNDDQSEAIRLKYYLDLDYGTIATLTRVSPGTVKSRIFEGLKKLRTLYRRNLDEQH